MKDKLLADEPQATQTALEQHRQWTAGAIHEVLSLIVNLEHRVAELEEATAKPTIEVVR